MADGIGCRCSARSAGGCGCPDVDWTPSELIEARKRIKELEVVCSEVLAFDQGDYFSVDDKEAALKNIISKVKSVMADESE